MSVGSITVDNVSRPAFMVRNEEQVALGTLVRLRSLKDRWCIISLNITGSR